VSLLVGESIAEQPESGGSVKAPPQESSERLLSAEARQQLFMVNHFNNHGRGVETFVESEAEMTVKLPAPEPWFRM
jgi:hypothetical protein